MYAARRHAPTSQRAVWMIGALCVLITCAALLAANARASTTTSVTWKSGVFAGYGGVNSGGVGDAAFGQWRGRPVSVATDFPSTSTWAQLDDPTSTLQAWAATPAVTPDLTLPLWPGSGGSLAESASGADNGYWITLAHNLVAAGLGKVGIRLGWEFNGTWYAWSVTNSSDAALFVQAWRQIVTAMRSVPGAHFTFVWCPVLNTGGIDPSSAYPGDAYVDDIGLDVYDWNGAGSNATAQQRWQALVNARYGLTWQANFAAGHNKPVAFPEWGLVYSVTGSTAGGDDPSFIQNMFNWFGSHNTDFEDYFDPDIGLDGNFYGMDTDGGTGNLLFPQSAALYQRLWAGAGANAASSTLQSLTLGLLG